jgi:hypothetical protein
MKVAILTNFREINLGYSLTGIVLDQIKMLNQFGNEVHLFVSTSFADVTLGRIGEAILHKSIPDSTLIDYTTKEDITPEHKQLAHDTDLMLRTELTGFDTVFTHDWIFTGWNMPYAAALMNATRSDELLGVKFMHWVHSVPSAGRDWWSIREYGPGNKIIYPNQAMRLQVSEQFQGKMDDVLVIPHIVDLRSLLFAKDTCEFVDTYQQVMQADVVQIYPASTDRLAAKRIREVILTFANLKKMGFSVCLVIANQWARKKESKLVGEVHEDILHYEKVARRNGLVPGYDFIFTSKWKRKYILGLPRRMVFELMHLANLMMYPTNEESFGLVPIEAGLAGSVLPVLNKSLSMMFEVHGFNGVYVDFGSCEMQFEPHDEAAYYHDLANLIVQRIQANEAIAAPTFYRQKYNWDTLYQKKYEPIMQALAKGL